MPHPEDDLEYAGFADRRARRIRIIAWVTIIALLIGGGGATAIALILG